MTLQCIRILYFHNVLEYYNDLIQFLEHQTTLDRWLFSATKPKTDPRLSVSSTSLSDKGQHTPGSLTNQILSSPAQRKPHVLYAEKMCFPKPRTASLCPLYGPVLSVKGPGGCVTWYGSYTKVRGCHVVRLVAILDSGWFKPPFPVSILSSKTDKMQVI